MSTVAGVGTPLDLPAIVPAELPPASPVEAVELGPQRRLTDRLACPRCHCKAVHRSRRRGFDWLMSAIGLRPARCFTCDKRFYVRQALIKAGSQRSA
jgi:hypothetical protein